MALLDCGYPGRYSWQWNFLEEGTQSQEIENLEIWYGKVPGTGAFCQKNGYLRSVKVAV